ncbi:hypothetical protein TNCV_391101 [Trichonephila clavipes]|nr:hypothetical protein TNCV_391101 [Trichonephila clavipes]
MNCQLFLISHLTDNPLLEASNSLPYLIMANYNLDLVLLTNKKSYIETDFPQCIGCMCPLRALQQVLFVMLTGYSQYFSFNRAVGANCTNFDAEVVAVQLALN